MKKLVNGKGRRRADSERGAERIGPRPKMRDRAKIFHGMLFLLERIVRRGGAFYNDSICLDFKWLLRLRRQHKRAGDDEGGAYILFCDFGKIRNGMLLENDLDSFKIAAVVQIDKTERFGVTYGTDPAAHRNFLAGERFGRRINPSNFCSFHLIPFLSKIKIGLP